MNKKATITRQELITLGALITMEIDEKEILSRSETENGKYNIDDLIGNISAMVVSKLSDHIFGDEKVDVEEMDSKIMRLLFDTKYNF